MQKDIIRSKLLARRKALSRQEVICFSKRIFKRFKHTKAYNISSLIMLYLAKGNEVDTLLLAEDLLPKKSLCVPYVSEDNNMIPVRLKSLKALKKGKFGILVPEFRDRDIVPIDKIELIIVPGIGFDRDGYRIGWGKAYYDRFLQKTRNSYKIGFAYSFQVMHKIPRQRHDIPVDMVITEKETIVVRRMEHNT